MRKTIKERILERAKALQEADEKACEPKAPEAPQPPKIEAVKKYLDLHGYGFGCQEGVVRGLLEVLLDQPEGTLERKKAERDVPPYPIGAIVVPLSNPNSHNYIMDVPAMIWVSADVHGARGLRMDGTMGNYLPSRISHPATIRFATPEEAKAFVDALKPSMKREIAKSLPDSK